LINSYNDSSYYSRTMYITVDVKPGQKKEIVEELEPGHLLVHVKAPATKGKANRAVIKALKRYYGGEVYLISGHTSSRKIFEVEK